MLDVVFAASVLIALTENVVDPFLTILNTAFTYTAPVYTEALTKYMFCVEDVFVNVYVLVL